MNVLELNILPTVGNGTPGGGGEGTQSSSETLALFPCFRANP